MSFDTGPTKPEYDEPLLPDDYPICAGFLYVDIMGVVRSDWDHNTAKEFRLREGLIELRRCDLSKRGYFDT